MCFFFTDARKSAAFAFYLIIPLNFSHDLFEELEREAANMLRSKSFAGQMRLALANLGAGDPRTSKLHWAQVRIEGPAVEANVFHPPCAVVQIGPGLQIPKASNRSAKASSYLFSWA